jgi:hypothetical protein
MIRALLTRIRIVPAPIPTDRLQRWHFAQWEAGR